MKHTPLLDDLLGRYQVAQLIPEIAGLGLAVALTSPGSVVTMIVLLSMPAGLWRGIAFIVGWLLAIGVLAVLLVFVLHGQNFGSRRTTPSRAASAAEVLLTSVLTVAAPVVVLLVALERSAEALASWKAWMLANSRSIALVALMVIGAVLLARGAYDLAAQG